MKKFAVLLSCCFISALLCVPSFAVSDPEPSDSSYSIQQDVSILAVPPAQTFASSSQYSQNRLTFPSGDWFIFYTMSGMEDSNAQYAMNQNIKEVGQFLYNHDLDILELKSSVSSALTQDGFEASMDKFWSIFDVPYLDSDGSFKQTTNAVTLTPKDWLRVGIMGLASKMGLGFPEGSSIYSGVTSSGWWDGKNYVLTGSNSSGGFQNSNLNFYGIMSALGNGVYSHSASFPLLYRSGIETSFTWDVPLIQVMQEGFLGFASVIRGVSNSSINGGILNSSDLSGTSFFANNLLSALSPVINIQNDLARLTHVIADPTEQSLHDATKDNVQSVTDNLTGEKGVTSQDIGDLSGISSGVGDFMTTGVSPDRLTGSISDEGNYSFFSQQTADDLHTFPAPQSADDDFIDFYAINRQEYSSLLGGDFDG